MSYVLAGDVGGTRARFAIFEMNASGWADIWEFDDRGRSEPSPGANDEAKVIGGDVPPDDLKLVYEAR